jgi:UDP-glucose 4-epimerase
MKIVILGCGYLGFNVNHILKNKYECEVWGLQSYYSSMIDNFKEIDVFNVEKLKDVDLTDRIIIDCVSLVSNTEKDENILGIVKEKYQSLFDVLKEKNIKRYIMLSSGGTIYGDSYKPISETHKLNPKSVYARSKYILEEMIKESGLNYLILRPTNPYGGIFEPGKTQGVISILIRKSLLEETFNLWIEDESVRDYIYITDFVNAIYELIKHDVNNDVFNISSSEGKSLKEVIETVEKNTYKKINIVSTSIDIPKIHSIVLSNKKLIEMTDYKPKISFNHGVKKEVERIRKELNL